MSRSPQTSADDACIRCGYALAGLPDDALCPECALPIARSRDRTRLLRSAHQPWLATTSRGLRDFSLAIYTLVIAIIAIILIAIIEELLLVRLGAMVSGSFAAVAFGLAAAAAAFLHIRGCIRITRSAHPDYALRPIVRWPVLVCGSLLPISAGISVFAGSWFIGKPAPESAFVLAAQINALLFLFAMQAATRHFEERTGAWSSEIERRQRNTRRNLIGFAIILALIFWVAGRPTASRMGDFGIVLIGIAYAFFSSAIVRTRSAIEIERRIAEHSGTEHAPPAGITQTPPSSKDS